MRRRLIETGDVDAMIAIRPNFFYTRTVPCELWFYDRGKPVARRDTVLMLDARQVYRKVTRKIYDFSPEQLADLTAVVWLYRGQHERFEALVAKHLGSAVDAAERCWVDEEADMACEPLDDFVRAYKALRALMQPFVASLPEGGEHEAAIADYLAKNSDPVGAVEAMRLSTTDLSGTWLKAGKRFEAAKAFHQDTLVGYAEHARDLSSRLDHATRTTLRMLDLAEKQLGARDDDRWPTREIGRARKALEAARGVAVEHLKRVRHFQRHAAWLLERFPDARYRDVTGLCKVVTRGEIEDADWSLTPGRYVGVAPVEEDEDFDFVEAFAAISNEIAELNLQAAALATRIEASAKAILA